MTRVKLTRDEKHSLELCKILWKQIQVDWGSGWRRLGDDLKKALIAERVMFTFTARDGIEGGPHIKSGEIFGLYTAMLDFCGLE